MLRICEEDSVICCFGLSCMIPSQLFLDQLWWVGQLRRTASKEKEIIVMQKPQFCWRDPGMFTRGAFAGRMVKPFKAFKRQQHRVVWIAQSGKALSFRRRGPGFESRGQPYPQSYTGDVDSGWRLIHRVRACNWHYANTSGQWHTQGFGRKKCRVVLPSRGPRLEKRREGCHVSKNWEYKEHLNGGVACCRLWISLLGWVPGFLSDD